MSKKKLLAVVAGTACATLAAAVAALYFAFGLTPRALAQTLRVLTVMRFIERRYVEPVSEDTLFEGAMTGVVKSLDDRYSAYLTPKMYAQLKEQTGGTFGGIGVVMGFNKDGSVHVVSVLEGTPGEAAGLAVGDAIVAVDGRPVNTMPAEEVALAIRGKVGTTVTVRIARNGADPRDYAITRADIRVRTARGKMLDDGLGYIRLSSFGEQTAAEFKAAFDELSARHMRGLLLDLRGNHGGYLSTCVDIARMLVPRGTIVSVAERNGPREEYTSTLAAPPCPLVVLVDQHSASAAEILAGALQDTRAATLVGSTTYGKGSVQVIIPMSTGGSAVKLTVAKYFTPSGRDINGVGIEPDVKVARPENDPGDAQLDRAQSLLRQQLAHQGGN